MMMPICTPNSDSHIQLVHINGAHFICSHLTANFEPEPRTMVARCTMPKPAYTLLLVVVDVIVL